MAEEPKKQKDEVETKVSVESDKPVFSWKASEFAQYSKKSIWFIIVSVAAVALALLLYLQQNWTGIAVVVAGAFALLSQARSKPKSISCTVYRQGIVINEKAYAYTEFKSFWIIYGDHPAVRFEPTKKFSVIVNVPIAEEDPEQIKLFLSKFLPMDEKRGEDIADTIQRWIKF